MILSLFLVLMAIAIILVVLGIWTREGVYSIVGFAFIFILSSTILIPNELYYMSGFTATQVAPCDNNCTEVRINDTIILGVVSTVSVTDTYTSYGSSATWFGIWLAIISALGLVLSLIEGSKTMFKGGKG